MALYFMGKVGRLAKAVVDSSTLPPRHPIRSMAYAHQLLGTPKVLGERRATEIVLFLPSIAVYFKQQVLEPIHEPVSSKIVSS